MTNGAPGGNEYKGNSTSRWPCFRCSARLAKRVLESRTRGHEQLARLAIVTPAVVSSLAAARALTGPRQVSRNTLIVVATDRVPTDRVLQIGYQAFRENR